MALSMEETLAEIDRRRRNPPMSHYEVECLFRNRGIDATREQINRLGSESGGPIVMERMLNEDRLGFDRQAVYAFIESEMGMVFCESHKARPKGSSFDASAAVKAAASRKLPCIALGGGVW